MRPRSSLPFILLGLAPPTPAQRFGFTHQMLPADVGREDAVAFGDVDGDGDLDLFKAGFVTQSRLYPNDSTGVFTDATATNLPLLTLPVSAVALGDLDLDGDLDALLGVGDPDSYGVAQNRLLRNGGTGVFTDVTATNIPAVFAVTTGVALGDVDGDGDLDAYVGTAASAAGTAGQDHLFRNGGAAVFTDVTTASLPVVVDFTLAVALGDVDVDGDLDAFVANAGQNRLHLNGGTGTFTDVTGTNLPSLLGTSRAVSLGDVDGDGDLDAFIGRYGSGGDQNRLYLNSGAGIYTDATAANLPALLGITLAVSLGDVDVDGDLDAWIGNWQQQNRLYENGGTGIFTDATATNLPSLVDYTRAVSLGDVDGDGDLDAVVANFYQDRLLLNDGVGLFTDFAGTNVPMADSQTGGVALGDVDGDGDLDAFVGNDGQDRLLLNGGTGRFTDVTTTGLPAILDTTTAVAFGDVDGDGDLDAFAANGVSGMQPSRLYLNGGTGVFTDVTASNLAVPVSSALAVALGDLDGDGDLDALVGNNGQDRVFLNGGAGVFADATATNLPSNMFATSSAVVLADVDGDGDLDAFFGGWTGSDRLYQNAGSAIFTDVTAGNLPVPWDQTIAAALGDVDGDGDADALVGNTATYPGAQDRLYLNSGSGSFTDVTGANLPVVSDMTYAVALGDVDGNGNLDALVGNDGQDRLYLNSGTGVFTDATTTDLPTLSDSTSAIALGDLDGDGDLDVFAGNAVQSGRTYTNLARQLAWRGIPRAGKPLALDIWGPAGGTWLLAASVGSANIPLPPFGTFRLFPPTLFIVAGGTLDPQGRANITFPVPANPAIVGLSLFWQAVVGPPLRFTNLEVTTVSNL